MADIKLLIKLLDKKIEYVSHLKNMSKNQESIINHEKADTLYSYMGKRKELIDEINKIDMAFIQTYNKFKLETKIRHINEADIKKYPELKELKNRTNIIMTLLEEMRINDEKNKVLMEGELSELKKKMKKLKTQKSSKKISSTYSKKYASVSGVFLDNK